MKKGDLYICGILCAVAAVFAAAFLLLKSNGKKVVVKQNNRVLAEYSLYEDREVDLGHNTFVISGGEVYMSRADCKNQICVNTGRISKRGECIVCLPNSIVLEIQ